MTRVVALLLVLVAAPARGHEGGFDQRLAAKVLAAGLEFITPRTLEPVTVPQLAGWGLRGIAALDPGLSAALADDRLQLSAGAQGILYSRPAPTAATGAAWAEALAQLAEEAVRRSDSLRSVGTQGVVQSLFDEMFNHLDPYSRYVVPAAADEDRAHRSGEAGAGLTLGQDGAGIVVRSVNADGSGYAAGLRAGDHLLAVNKRPTRGQDASTVSAWVAGKAGSVVELLVRDGRGRVRRVAAERAVTPPETVFASRIGDLLVLRVSFFAEDTDARVGAELVQAMGGHRPVRGAILDLRDNRGGLLRQAVAASELILGGGLVVTTAGRDPQASHVWTGEGPDLLAGKPVVVLVDGRTASAAEIMAAALADRGRAVVAGSATFGKGLVQAVTTLPDGGELFVSWSRLLAPDGWPLQDLGVMPQVCTSLGEAFVREQLGALGAGRVLLGPALARTRAARPPLPQAQAIEMREACPASVGRDGDLDAARWLLDHSAAYGAALLPEAMRAGP